MTTHAAHAEKGARGRKKGAGPTRFFRLLAGQHQESDFAAGPIKEEYYDDDGELQERTRVPVRFPTKTYTPGQVVESDKDLVALFGANKFQEVVRREGSRGRARFEVPSPEDVEEIEGESRTPGDPTPLNAQAPRTFPHGQVYQGHAATTSMPDPAQGVAPTEVRQFAIPPEEAREMAEKHADRLPTPKEEKTEKGGARKPAGTRRTSASGKK